MFGIGDSPIEPIYLHYVSNTSPETRRAYSLIQSALFHDAFVS